MATVIIVGGGIAGTSLAYHLRESEHEVRVLEKDGLGAGTTGKSIGCFAWYDNYEGMEYEITERSWEIYEPLIEDGTLSYHENGFMKVANSAAFFDQLRESVAELRDAGIPATVLEDEELRGLNVDPDSVGAGATFYPSIGRLDTGEIVSHFADRARENGAEIEIGTAVTDIRTENGSVTGVETDAGTYDAEILINAAGPWAPVCNAMAGVDLPLKHTLAPISVLDTAENFELPTVIIEDGAYFTGERSAKTLAGHSPHESSDEGTWEAARELERPDSAQGIGIGSVDEEHRTRIAEQAHQYVPKLADAEVSNEWCGIRCATPDHRPVVGPTRIDGFHVLTGMSGEGITMAPGCAALLAEHLQNDGISPELEYLSPGRF
jgi:sarcosine oxidase subunit beta